MDPPPGHAFQLELDTARMSQRNLCVRVELLCTCTREQLGQDMLCCLQDPEEELRRKQEPSLLHTLCTGSCLDVETAARWFCRFVRIAWLLLPQSYRWHLMLHPSSHSCTFQLSKDKESFMAGTISGVRQGDSNTFVGSQPTEVGVLSTTWPDTYAVAEAKFFRSISRQPPRTAGTASACSSSAAPCLGVGFSSYTLKMVLMQLLSTVPLTRWCRGDFWQWLMDILEFLHCSLQTEQLHHFVTGNERLPLEISLPSDLQVAEPPNLFQHLASNQDAHVQEHICLRHRLKQLLIHGH